MHTLEFHHWCPSQLQRCNITMQPHWVCSICASNHMLCRFTCERQSVCVCKARSCSPGTCRSCTQWKVVATARSCAVRPNKSYAPSSTQASKVGGGVSMTGRVALMSSSAVTNAEIMLVHRTAATCHSIANPDAAGRLVLPSDITQTWCLLRHRRHVHFHAIGMIQQWALMQQLQLYTAWNEHGLIGTS